MRTTLDAKLQKLANQAVARQMAQLQKLADGRRKAGQERAVLQAGFLALDPRNGAVRAWVGSRDFAQEQFDHVSQARRQPGSTFKPFVYGAAFMQGLSPSYTLIDQPVAITSPGGEVWTPSDATPPTGQPMSLRDGLVYSKNTITAQLMQKVGPATRGAAGAGHGRAPEQARPGALAGAGHQPGHAAGNGRGLRHHRQWRQLHAAGAGDAAWKTATASCWKHSRPSRSREPAMPRASALTLVNVMRGVIDEGTGAAIRQRYGIQADVAGKTGTTQDNTDGWFIMMNPQLVAGARVGFNDNSVTMGDLGPGRPQRAAHGRRCVPAGVSQPLARPERRVRHPAPRPQPPPPEPPAAAAAAQ